MPPKVSFRPKPTLGAGSPIQLSMQVAGPTYLSRPCFLPKSRQVLAGNQCQEPELGIEPKHLVLRCGHFNSLSLFLYFLEVLEVLLCSIVFGDDKSLAVSIFT